MRAVSVLAERAWLHAMEFTPGRRRREHREALTAALGESLDGVALTPDHAYVALVRLGDIDWRDNQPVEAVASWVIADSRMPVRCEASTRLAQAAMLRGEYGRAFDWSSRACANDLSDLGDLSFAEAHYWAFERWFQLIGSAWWHFSGPSRAGYGAIDQVVTNGYADHPYVTRALAQYRISVRE